MAETEKAIDDVIINGKPVGATDTNALTGVTQDPACDSRTGGLAVGAGDDANGNVAVVFPVDGVNRWNGRDWPGVTRCAHTE